MFLTNPPTLSLCFADEKHMQKKLSQDYEKFSALCE
jgi:hypothetical protein